MTTVPYADSSNWYFWNPETQTWEAEPNSGTWTQDPIPRSPQDQQDEEQVVHQYQFSPQSDQFEQVQPQQQPQYYDPAPQSTFVQYTPPTSPGSPGQVTLTADPVPTSTMGPHGALTIQSVVGNAPGFDYALFGPQGAGYQTEQFDFKNAYFENQQNENPKLTQAGQTLFNLGTYLSTLQSLLDMSGDPQGVQQFFGVQAAQDYLSPQSPQNFKSAIQAIQQQVQAKTQLLNNDLQQYLGGLGSYAPQTVQSPQANPFYATGKYTINTQKISAVGNFFVSAADALLTNIEDFYDNAKAGEGSFKTAEANFVYAALLADAIGFLGALHNGTTAVGDAVVNAVNLYQQTSSTNSNIIQSSGTQVQGSGQLKYYLTPAIVNGQQVELLINPQTGQPVGMLEAVQGSSGSQPILEELPVPQGAQITYPQGYLPNAEIQKVQLQNGVQAYEVFPIHGSQPQAYLDSEGTLNGTKLWQLSSQAPTSQGPLTSLVPSAPQQKVSQQPQSGSQDNLPQLFPWKNPPQQGQQQQQQQQQKQQQEVQQQQQELQQLQQQVQQQQQELQQLQQQQRLQQLQQQVQQQQQELQQLQQQVQQQKQQQQQYQQEQQQQSPQEQQQQYPQEQQQQYQQQYQPEAQQQQYQQQYQQQDQQQYQPEYQQQQQFQNWTYVDCNGQVYWVWVS